MAEFKDLGHAQTQCTTNIAETPSANYNPLPNNILTLSSSSKTPAPNSQAFPDSAWKPGSMSDAPTYKYRFEKKLNQKATKTDDGHQSKSASARDNDFIANNVIKPKEPYSKQNHHIANKDSDSSAKTPSAVDENPIRDYGDSGSNDAPSYSLPIPSHTANQKFLQDRLHQLHTHDSQRDFLITVSDL